LAITSQDNKIPSKKKRYSRIAIVLGIIILLNVAGTWIGHQINFQLFPRHESMLQVALLIALLTYILLMATPFMPGIELGLAVMLLLGSKSALLIYLCTLISLSISYTIGRFFPIGLVLRFLKWLCLEKASELIRQLEPLDQQERLAFLYSKTPSKIAPYLLKHRFVTIAVLLNLPGNALVGGGGGIGLMVGMSKLVSFHKYLLIMAVAILPVPLCVYIQGSRLLAVSSG
jgi:hypothetical protein